MTPAARELSHSGQEDVLPPGKVTLNIILTCHAPYLRWLPEAVASIDRQLPPDAEALVAFDGCDPIDLPPRWRALTGVWGHPAGGRNAGLAATHAPWVIFWDADNRMAEGYIAAVQRAIQAAPLDLAIIYPDLLFCDEHMRPQRRWSPPAWEYWEMRAEHCADTASAWRRGALDMVGGWLARDGALDDYLVGLRITALGWKARKLDGPPVLTRRHDQNMNKQRFRTLGIHEPIWRSRSLAIVSPLSGRPGTLERWSAFLAAAQLPDQVALYVVDNSGSPAFHRQVMDACDKIATARRFVRLEIAPLGQPYVATADEPYLARERHLHVARLYASVLPRVAEDLVLTLEDDVQPPLDAVRRLSTEIGYRSFGTIGAAAAAYTMTHRPDAVCAGWGSDTWGRSVRWNELPDQPIDVGFVGGGCTVWANWALHDQPVQIVWEQLLGWDAMRCLALRKRGYRVRLHGGVRCDHTGTER